MILKVRGTGEQESWRFYDGISEVQTSVGPRADYSGLGSHPDVQEEWFEIDTPAPVLFVFVAFLDKDGNPRHVIANTEVFLMNDNGRTIERLHH